MSDDQDNREVQARAELRGVLPTGTKLRGYELTSVLGQGAFGITYRAIDSTLHREVAIKEYLPATLALREGRTTVLPRSPDHAEQFAWGRDRFLEEARTLARLERAPGIVRVYDYLEDNGTAYMVMALIEGRPSPGAWRGNNGSRRVRSIISSIRCSTGWRSSMPRPFSIATSSRPTSWSTPAAGRP